MNFVSYHQMIVDAQALARRLSRNIVGVLGVPRSGMLVASVIAQELDCHLADVHTFATNGYTFMRPGRRMNWNIDSSGPIVVVDDSVHAGAAMDAAKSALFANPFLSEQYDIQTAALYVTPGSENKVHWVGAMMDQPRLFEWNWRHSDILSYALLDMDGVLCKDPPCFDDGGKMYNDFIVTACPLYLPRRKIMGIVTGRLEKWRIETSQWLKDFGVEYDLLIMGPWSDEEQRRGHNKAGEWKAQVYKENSDARLFIESDPNQAKTIWCSGGGPVLCPSTGIFLP